MEGRVGGEEIGRVERRSFRIEVAGGRGRTQVRAPQGGSHGRLGEGEGELDAHRERTAGKGLKLL